MKPTLINSKTIILSMVLAGAMALQPIASHAASNNTNGLNSSDDAAYTCASAVNVMDCIKQTQDGTVQQVDPNSLKSSVSLSNQTFGLSGPINFNVRYDSDLAWIIDAGYAQKLGDRAAVALKASAGFNEYRGNATLGFAITPKQQIKITYEYLTQNLPFDYSTGTIDQWVSQNAYGAAYRYMVGNSVLRGIELSGSYTQANSKNLSDVNMAATNQIEERRIAGGQQKSGLASVILTPFKNTLIKVGGGYSASSFDTQWESNQANSTIAYSVEASQLITPKTLVSAGVNNTSANTAGTVKVSQILPGHLEGNITGQYNASHVEGIASNSSISAGLSYPAPKTYSNMFDGSIGDLKSWVEQPVIYNTRVLAIAEERLLSTKISVAPIQAADVPVGETLKPIQLTQYFTFDPTTFSKVDYKISSVTLKSDPKTTFDPSYLKLEIVAAANDNYNAALQSSDPMPAAALTTPGPGQYVVTLLASGYRNGQVVNTASDSVDINVDVNKSLTAPSWKPGVSLNGATANQTYPGTDLLTLVKDNTGLPAPGDQYTFVVSDLPQPPNNWLVLDADGHTLKGTSVKVPQSASNPTPIKIYVHSKVSDKDITDADGTPDATKSFDITVSGTGTAPVWKSDATIPDPNIYGDYGTKKVDLSDDITSSGTASTDMKFSCVDGCPSAQTLPVDGLALNINGAITGTPSNSTQFGQPKTFTIQALNSANISAPKVFTITVQPNSDLDAPQWIPSNDSYAKGYVGNPYGGSDKGLSLNTYFSSTIKGDTITYAITDKGQCSDWLSLSNGNSLTGTPSKVVADCGVKIKATSTLSGNSFTPGDGGTPTRALQVLANAPVWNITNFPTQQKYQDNITIPLSPYVSDSDPKDTFTFAVTSGTLPSGFRLENGAIVGAADKMSDIGQTLPTFTITATSVNDNNLVGAAQPLTLNIVPNPSLPFAPTMNNLPSGTPGLTYTRDLKDYVTLPADKNVSGDYITNYTLGTNNCNNDNSMGWTSPLQMTNNTTTGTISGFPNSDNSSCKFSVTVTSFATGKTFPLNDNPITITPDVSWTGQALWKGNIPKYQSGASSEAIINNGYVTSASSSPITISSLKLLNGVTLGAGGVVNTDTTILNNVSTSSTACEGLTDSTITLHASSTIGGNGEDHSFTNQVCLLPNTTLTSSAVTNSKLDDAAYGVAYPTTTLNPYVNSKYVAGNTKYVSPTKSSDGTTIVDDELTFSLSGDAVQNGKACGWLSLDSSGVFTGTNVGQANYCSFFVSIHSKAMNTTTQYPMNIATTGQAPTWIKSGPVSMNITAVKTKGQLLDASYITANSATPSVPLTITMDPNSPDYNKFEIYNPSPNVNYLVLIEDKISANFIGNTYSVTLDAYNAANQGGKPSQADFKITVYPDQSVKIRWAGENPVVLPTSASGQTTYPSGAYLESKLESYFMDGNNPVIIHDDMYIMNAGSSQNGGPCMVSGVVNTGGYQYSFTWANYPDTWANQDQKDGPYFRTNGQYYIVTQGYKNNQYPLGTFDFNLYGLSSKAQSPNRNCGAIVPLYSSYDQSTRAQVTVDKNP